MLIPFFIQAVVSPARQRVLRGTTAAHLVLLAWTGGTLLQVTDDIGRLRAEWLLGHLLLTAGMVEGALLIGWRLSQLPKSQALEFLLVTPLRAPRVLLAEALVGFGRLTLVTLSGLPILVLLFSVGRLAVEDVLLLLVLPWTWGALIGLLFTTWAYETRAVRRWGERIMIFGLLLYLTVGVLAAENLVYWLQSLPEEGIRFVLQLLRGFHENNPFGLLHVWFTLRPSEKWEAAVTAVSITGAALVLAGLLLARCAGRLRAHFHERHYRPVLDDSGSPRTPVSEQPLAWWAVRRVSEYSGQINLWLAGGFCLLYALYTVAGEHWPPALGRQVFRLADGVGGIPVLAAALIVLATVPAAFQYGLWDSSAQDRCRRLELLLLTRLEGVDYWHAAAAAAWQRGSGYFAMALLLWAAALHAGQMTLAMAATAVAAAVLTWGWCFVLGFRDFARGRNAHTVGLFLTLGLPTLAVLAYHLDWPNVGDCLPPGCIYAAASQPLTWIRVIAMVLLGGCTLAAGRFARAHCVGTLRAWYELHSGCKVVN